MTTCRSDEMWQIICRWSRIVLVGMMFISWKKSEIFLNEMIYISANTFGTILWQNSDTENKTLCLFTDINYWTTMNYIFVYIDNEDVFLLRADSDDIFQKIYDHSGYQFKFWKDLDEQKACVRKLKLKMTNKKWSKSKGDPSSLLDRDKDWTLELAHFPEFRTRQETHRISNSERS